MAEDGKKSWAKSWERAPQDYGSMTQAIIPVHSHIEGDKKEVGLYTIPIPDVTNQFDEFHEWAIDRLGAETAMEAFVSGVQVKIAGQIRGGANQDPDKMYRKASESMTRLDPDARQKLLTELRALEAAEDNGA